MERTKAEQAGIAASYRSEGFALVRVFPWMKGFCNMLWCSNVGKLAQNFAIFAGIISTEKAICCDAKFDDVLILNYFVTMRGCRSSKTLGAFRRGNP